MRSSLLQRWRNFWIHLSSATHRACMFGWPLRWPRIFEPEILVVDEVLAVGDAAFQKKCLGKMQNLARGGRTVLFVSHNMGAINTLCQRTAYIDKGQLKAIGATREIVPMYLSNAFESQAKSIDQLRWPGTGKRVQFLEYKITGPRRCQSAVWRPFGLCANRVRERSGNRG